MVTDLEDRMRWKEAKDGNFSVKSLYIWRLAVQFRF